MISEKDIFARYGIDSSCATPSEYAANVEHDAENGTDNESLLSEIRACISAALKESEFKGRNPWFTNRQMAIIETYMSGGFALELLASRADPAKSLPSFDELLARLVAACDPALSGCEERLRQILEEAGKPDYGSVKATKAPDDAEVLIHVSFSRGVLREMAGSDIPDGVLKRLALRIENAMLDAVNNLDIKKELKKLSKNC